MIKIIRNFHHSISQNEFLISSFVEEVVNHIIFIFVYGKSFGLIMIGIKKGFVMVKKIYCTGKHEREGGVNGKMGKIM